MTNCSLIIRSKFFWSKVVFYVHQSHLHEFVYNWQLGDFNFIPQKNQNKHTNGIKSYKNTILHGSTNRADRHIHREIDERMNKQISNELKYTKFKKIRINSQHICFRKEHYLQQYVCKLQTNKRLNWLKMKRQIFLRSTISF